MFWEEIIGCRAEDGALNRPATLSVDNRLDGVTDGGDIVEKDAVVSFQLASGGVDRGGLLRSATFRLSIKPGANPADLAVLENDVISAFVDFTTGTLGNQIKDHLGVAYADPEGADAEDIWAELINEFIEVTLTNESDDGLGNNTAFCQIVPRYTNPGVLTSAAVAVTITPVDFVFAYDAPTENEIPRLVELMPG